MNKFLQTLEPKGINLSLDKIKEALEKIGNPQLKYKTIHVAGTNGKGSTAAILATILNEAKFKVGLYTSPHLINFNERIKINNIDIPEKNLNKLIAKYKHLATNLSFFEFTTLLAFEYFKENNVDYAVIETGLGGRLDATNTIYPEIAIITNITLEHQDYLGNTIEKIAKEKSGIIKPNIKILTKSNTKALEVIQSEAEKKKAHLIKPINTKFTLNHPYQQPNIDLAAQAALELNIDSKIIEQALKKVVLPARYQIIKQDNRNIILDLAHNPGAMKLLCRHIPKNSTIVFGCLKDKNYQDMLKAISETEPSKIILTTPKSDRALNPKIINTHKLTNAIVVEDLNNALKTALEEKTDIIITGSFYLVGPALQELTKSSITKYLLGKLKYFKIK